jgi:pullulanase
MAKSENHIAHAFWDSSDSGLIILSRNWESTTDLPPLFLGPENLSFEKLERISPEECGRYCRYYRKKNSWIFALQSRRYRELLGRYTKVFLGADFNGWEAAIGKSKWELKPESDASDAIYELCVPLKSLPQDEKATFKFVTDSGEWLDVPDSAPNRVSREDGVSNFEFNPKQSGRHIFRFRTPEGYEPVGNEKIVWRTEGEEEIHELPHTQYLTSASSELALGAIVENVRTVFRLFAPRAKAVKVAF